MGICGSSRVVGSAVSVVVCVSSLAVVNLTFFPFDCFFGAAVFSGGVAGVSPSVVVSSMPVWSVV